MSVKTVVDNINYAAVIKRLQNVRKHSNADRLNCCSVEYNNCIVGQDLKDGDYVVYFPLECQMNADMLSYLNQFADTEKNRDKTVKGYFGTQRRVRTLKLRGEKSEGFVMPLENFISWIDSLKGLPTHPTLEEWQGMEDKHFQTLEFGSVQLQVCIKYELPVKQEQGAQKKKKSEDKLKYVLIPGQFRLGEDVPNIRRCLSEVIPTPATEISVSYKMHGCSATIGNVLTCRKLSLFEKLIKKFVKLETSEYAIVHASRNVIKGASNNKKFTERKQDHFYDRDIWGLMAAKYAYAIEPGITLYGEIVGRDPLTLKYVQKDYDYGLKGDLDFFVFRMTYTTPQGNVMEFSTRELVAYCKKYGLKYAPVFYIGRASDLFEMSYEDEWHKTFLTKLEETYTDKKCFMCDNNVPEEGVVIRTAYGEWHCGKLKSFKFLERETVLLDQNVTNMEDEDAANTQL